MTNKEALEIIGVNTDYKDYSNETIYNVNEAFRILEDSIERLEKLEKVIEILKRVCLFEFEEETIYPQDKWADCYVIYVTQFNNGFNKEEYDLLKEELEEKC